MDEQEFEELKAPSTNNLDTMSAWEREIFADTLRDEWDQDSYLA